MFSEYKIIVISDRVTDSSEKIYDKYAKEFSQIQVLHKENEGLSNARTKDLELAKAEYIAYGYPTIIGITGFIEENKNKVLSDSREVVSLSMSESKRFF